MNITGFLKQTVTYNAKTGETAGGWGNPAYGATVSLPARKVEKQRLMRNASGVEVLSTTEVLLGGALEPHVSDQIDGQEIQARESIVDFDGSIIGWTVYL